MSSSIPAPAPAPAPAKDNCIASVNQVENLTAELRNHGNIEVFEPLVSHAIQQDSGQFGSSSSDSNQKNSAKVPLEQLSGEEATLELDRAEEKIRQNIRSLPKLNAAKRQIITSIRQEYEKSHALNYPPLPVEAEVLDPDEGDSVCSVGGESVGITSVASGPEASTSSPIKHKIRVKAPKKIYNVEIEPPKVAEADTDPKDPRYFQPTGKRVDEGPFVYDFLYQHQRGIYVFGIPKFSSKSLLPVDPYEWTDDKFRPSGMDIKDYILPDPGWEWVHKSWMVDMTGDVDEDGWEYAMTFHASPWHGNFVVLQSFVRRRRWLRLRKRKGIKSGKPDPLPERDYPASINSTTWTKINSSPNYLDEPSPFPDDDELEQDEPDGELGRLKPPKKLEPIDIYNVMKKARSDREKLAYAAQYVVRYHNQLSDLENQVDKFMNLFDYESTRSEFLTLLKTYSRTSPDIIQNSASRLEFLSDRKKFDIK